MAKLRNMPTDDNFVMISSETFTYYGLKSDGSLVAWGRK